MKNKSTQKSKTALTASQAGQALYLRSLGIFSARELAVEFGVPRTTMLNVLTRRYKQYQVEPIETELSAYLQHVKRTKEQHALDKEKKRAEREEYLKPYYEQRQKWIARASYIRWLRENTDMTVKAICDKYKCNRTIFYSIINYERFPDVVPAIPPEYLQ